QQRQTIDSWRYRIEWKPVASAAGGDVSGIWTLVVPAAGAQDDLAVRVARGLTERDASVVVVSVTHEDADRARLGARLREVVPEGGALRGVLSLGALDETGLPTHPAVPAGLAVTLALVQALGDLGIEAPLWLLTRGGVSVGRTDPI